MNSRGQILLLITLPILLVTSCTILAGTLLLSSYYKNQKLCRSGVLESQYYQATALKKLLSLNPLAKTLRESETIAEVTRFVSLAMPGLGPLIAPALAASNSITDMRIALDKLQKSLIAEANVKSIQSLNLVAANIKMQKNDIEKLAPPTLKVEPIQPGTVAPEYKTQNNFEYIQESRLEYRIKIIYLLPKWLQKIVPSSKDIKLSCSSTIVKNGGNQWQNIMTMDK